MAKKRTLKASIYSTIVAGGLAATLIPGSPAHAQADSAKTAASSSVQASSSGCYHHKKKITLPKKKPKGVNAWGYLHTYRNKYDGYCGKDSYIWIKVIDTANDSRKAYVQIKDEYTDKNGNGHTIHAEKRAPGGKGNSAKITYRHPHGAVSIRGCVDNDNIFTKPKCTAYKFIYSAVHDG